MQEQPPEGGDRSAMPAQGPTLGSSGFDRRLRKSAVPVARLRKLLQTAAVFANGPLIESYVGLFLIRVLTYCILQRHRRLVGRVTVAGGSSINRASRIRTFLATENPWRLHTCGSQTAQSGRSRANTLTTPRPARRLTRRSPSGWN